MSEYQIYLSYFSKTLISIKAILSKPTALYFLIPSISLALFSTLQVSLILMVMFFILDFVTGILASWIEQKSSKKPIKVYLIESSKLRKSVVKAITYAIFIGSVLFFEKAFFIKQIIFESISDKRFTITMIAVIFCCIIELFSVLENLKRSGYDLIGNFRKIVLKIKSLIKVVKDE